MYFYTEYGAPGKFRSIELLQRERLLEIGRVNHMGTLDVGVFSVTPLGISFVNECSPEVVKRAAEREKRPAG
jgi:hypothetical protein